MIFLRRVGSCSSSASTTTRRASSYCLLAAAAAATTMATTTTTSSAHHHTAAFFMNPGKKQGRVPGFRAPPSILSMPFSTQPMAEKVLQNPQWPDSWPYSKEDFARADESADEIFYDQARLVYHIDDAAVKALTKYYADPKVGLKNGDNVLDLCSSWVSHYPPDWKGGEMVVGLGMNEYELSQNPVLTSYVVKDLNKEPKMPFDDATFDKVTCVVSVDYLNKPLEVFKEIGRILKPGGECILSMSNRCFPTKAFQIWLQTSDLEHIFIAGSFFHYSGLFEPPTCKDISPFPGMSDPLYIVSAKRKAQ